MMHAPRTLRGLTSGCGSHMSRRQVVTDPIEDRIGQGYGSQTKLRAAPRHVQLLREVVVTGIGTILPNCDNRDVFWQQLKGGE